MKIRITEPVFFLGQERKVGDILDDVKVGPYRRQVIPGGLARIPQFVEMADEIKQVIQDAAKETVTAADIGKVADVLPLTPTLAGVSQLGMVSQQGATAQSALAAPTKSTKPNPLAARVRALTARRAKFSDFAAGLLDTGEKHMSELETNGPDILKRGVDSTKDEIDAIVDLDDAMKQFAAANGGDPLDKG